MHHRTHTRIQYNKKEDQKYNMCITRIQYNIRKRIRSTICASQEYNTILERGSEVQYVHHRTHTRIQYNKKEDHIFSVETQVTPAAVLTTPNHQKDAEQ